MEQQGIIRVDEIKSLQAELNSFKRQNEALEERNKELEDQLKISEDTVIQLQTLQNERETMRASSAIRGATFFEKAEQYVEVKDLKEAEQISNDRLKQLTDMED